MLKDTKYHLPDCNSFICITSIKITSASPFPRVEMVMVNGLNSQTAAHMLPHADRCLIGSLSFSSYRAHLVIIAHRTSTMYHVLPPAYILSQHILSATGRQARRENIPM